VALGAEVRDDCGYPLDAGTVVVSFSNGESPLSLQPMQGGRWEGTWANRGASLTRVALKIQAADVQDRLRGEREVSGQLEAQADPPVLTSQGIVSAAWGQPFTPLAPGSIISVFGDRLAQSTQAFNSTPLPNTLASTQVIMAGRQLPLYFVSQNQINAQIHFDINVNTTHQVVVRQGSAYSQPVPVDVAPAQPAIFTDASVGPRQGIFVVVRQQNGSQTQFLATPETPARAGDVVVIYCAGLGATAPALSAGASAGNTLTPTTQEVQLRIGDRTAQVLFAGITPGFVGLYQVNAVIPPNVPTGDSVSLTLSIAGQSSQPVVTAIE
jgi:uncharacterized protein (TIGR03437 family)